MWSDCHTDIIFPILPRADKSWQFLQNSNDCSWVAQRRLDPMGISNMAAWFGEWNASVDCKCLAKYKLKAGNSLVVAFIYYFCYMSSNIIWGYAKDISWKRNCLPLWEWYSKCTGYFSQDIEGFCGSCNDLTFIHDHSWDIPKVCQLLMQWSKKVCRYCPKIVHLYSVNKVS